MSTRQERSILHGAVYGAGFMGKTHFTAYQEIPHAEIIAVIDPVISRAQKLVGITKTACYTSIKEASIAQSLDFIDICVPTPFHRIAVEQAFKSGSPVIVEKPLTADVKELSIFQELEHSYGKRVMTAHVCRFMPIFLYAKLCVDTQRLGKPLAYSGLRYSQLPDWSHKDWINKRELSGGTIIDLSIHDVDIANWLLGEPLQVYGTETVREENGPSHAMGSIIYTSGATAHIEASHLLPDGYGLKSSYKMVFEKGVIQAEMYEGHKKVREFSQGSWKEIDVRDLVTHENPYTEELAHFIDALLMKTPFRVPLSDALLAVKTVIALRDSVKERKEIMML